MSRMRRLTLLCRDNLFNLTMPGCRVQPGRASPRCRRRPRSVWDRVDFFYCPSPQLPLPLGVTADLLDVLPIRDHARRLIAQCPDPSGLLGAHAQIAWPFSTKNRAYPTTLDSLHAGCPAPARIRHSRRSPPTDRVLITFPPSSWIGAGFCRARSESRWSARSAARTYDLDCDLCAAAQCPVRGGRPGH
jgi:hypothetical protein